MGSRCSALAVPPPIRARLNRCVALVCVAAPTNEMKMAGKRFRPRWPPTSIRPQFEMAVLEKKRDARQALVNRFLEACRLGQPAAVEECITQGISAETCFPDGVPAILKAADNGFISVVKVLLQHGEKVDTKLGQPEVPPTSHTHNPEHARRSLLPSPGAAFRIPRSHLLCGGRSCGR